MIIDWLYLLFEYNYDLPRRSKVCKFPGRFKCFAPSSPIRFPVIGLSKTYVTSQLLIHLSFYYTHSHSLYWFPCVWSLIGCIYCIIYNHYLQSRFKVCKFAGSFKCFTPSAPMSLSVVGLSKTYVTSKPVVDIFINHLLYT